MKSRKALASQSKETPATERPPPQRRATINDVARLAGVSKKTVSRVINKSPYVREETRVKISAAIEDLNFAPDPQARGLALRRSHLIGLVHDHPNAQYVVDIQQGVCDAVRGSGYELVVHPCSDSKARLLDIRGFIERQKPAGIVLLPPLSDNEDIAALLREHDCPYVRISSTSQDIPLRLVESLDRGAAATAAEYLMSLGHKRIGLIAGPKLDRTAHERRLGFTEAMKKRGLKLTAELIADGANTSDSGAECAASLLSQDPRPTAIFAGNDEMAAGVYRAAQLKGLRIPEDLSVMTFEDGPLAACLSPKLSVVRSPVRYLGGMAALRLLPKGVRTDAEIGDAAPALIIRGSTRDRGSKTEKQDKA